MEEVEMNDDYINDLVSHNNELLKEEDINKKKRGIFDVDKSPPTLASSSSSNKPASSLTDQTNSTRIAPIIYFKPDPKYLKDKTKLSKHLEEINRFLKVEIKVVKITANGNLLVFFNNDNDKQKLFESKFFEQYRKIDLGLSEPRPQAILCDLFHAPILELLCDSFFLDLRNTIIDIG
jgi:hypothetical protein